MRISRTSLRRGGIVAVGVLAAALATTMTLTLTADHNASQAAPVVHLAAAPASTGSTPPGSVFNPNGFTIPYGFQLSHPAASASPSLSLEGVLKLIPPSQKVIAVDLVNFSMTGRSDLQDVLAYAVVEDGPLDLSVMPHRLGASNPSLSPSSTPEEQFFTIYSASSGAVLAQEGVPLGESFPTAAPPSN